MFFHKKNKKSPGHYDPSVQKPAIRCSICTGEQTAGFLDRETGSFTDVMLLRNEEDLRQFCEEYGITEAPEKFY